MFKRLVVLVPALALAVSVFAYPTVGKDPNNVQPNFWTSQLAAARTRAGQLGLPMLVMCVDTVTCGNCKKWDDGVLKNAAWPVFLAQYPMMLVMLDRSSLSATSWNTLTQPYRGAGGSLTFPTAAVHAPSGVKLGQFNYGMGTGYFQTPGFMNKILTYSLPYYNTGPGTIGLSLAAQSVAEDGGAVTVTVTRTEGKTGAQSFLYATADGTAVAGVDYTAASGTLAWADGEDAAKTFTVPLIDNGRWTAPSQRVFTVTIAQTAGDADTGVTTQTVTINEAEPYAPGTLGFSDEAGEVVEGVVYTGTVSRTGGAVGEAGVTLMAPVGCTVDPAALTWADGDSAEKTFTVSGIAATEPYDPRAIELSLALSGGAASLGTAVQTVSVLDQAVSETFEDYTEDRPVYEFLTQEDELWFYNEGLDALRTEPLNGGAQAALAWTAPGAGRLSFTWGQNGVTLPDGAIGPLVLDAEGVLVLHVGAQQIPLASLETNNTVGVRAGEVVRWVATGAAGDYMAYVKGLAWEPLAPVTAVGLAPAAESKLQIDDVRADTNLVDLVWQAGAGNPAGTVQRLFAGPSADALAEVAASGDVASGVNALDLGLVTLDEAQGWIAWRVDTVLAADFGAAVSAGPVWRFAVVDLPIFTGDSPAAGGTLDAFLRAGAVIQVAADSTTPVTYSATGLPPGLAIDPATGAISGVARSTGAYAVTVTASNSEGATTLAFTIRTQGLPDYAAGTALSGALFESMEERMRAPEFTRPVVGTLSFKVSSSGRITAKVDSAGRKHSLRGAWETGAPDGTFRAAMTSRSGEVLDVALTADGVLHGTFDGYPVLARAASAGAALPYEGYYTAAFEAEVLEVGSETLDNRPEGFSYVTMTVSRAGKVKYSGVLADGARLSGSAMLMVFSGTEMQAMGYDVAEDAAYAAFPLYAPLYRRRGSASALIWIAANAEAGAGDNTVWLDSSRWFYPGKSSVMTDDAFLADLSGRDLRGRAFSDGAAEVGAFYAKNQDLTASFTGASFRIEDSDEWLPVTVTSRSLTLARGNALNGRLKASASTGLFSGSFRLADPDTGRFATHRYKGALVKRFSYGFGLGAYQRRDNQSGSYRLERSKAVVIGPDPL